MGVYATRLSQVMLAQQSLFEQDKQALNTAAERLEDAAREFDQLKAIESMFGGDTDVAIRDTASKITRVIEATQRDIVTMKNATEDGRLGIEAARQAYQSLPSAQPNLIEQALGTAMKVFVPGVGILAGSAFLQFVTAAREAERERQAMQALMKLRGDMADYHWKLPLADRADLSIGRDGEQDNSSSAPGDGSGNGSGSGNGTGSGNGPGALPSSIMNGVARATTNMGDAAVNRLADAAVNGELSPAERVRQAIDNGLNSIAYDEIAGVDSQNGYPGIVAPKSPLPSTDQWPFDVYHPGDINRDGPLQGGYRVNLDSSQFEMPRDPMLRSTIEEGKHQLGGQLGALGVSGAALGAGALAVGAARGGAITGGAVPGGAMGGFAGGAPGAAGGASDKKGQKSGGRLGAGRGGAARAGGGIGAGARGGAAAGARGGMMGGMAGGAQGAGGANDKKSQKSANRLGGGGARGGAAGARGGAAGARGAASGAGARGGAAAGARGGMMGAGMMGAGRGSDEKRERENRSYGSSGVEFFDMSEEQQLDAAGRSGKAGGKVIQVVEKDDSRW